MAEWLEERVRVQSWRNEPVGPTLLRPGQAEVRDPELGSNLPSDPVSPFLTRLNWTELGT